MAEPKFKPRPGQVDYTDVRYCPVFNSVVMHAGKVLLLKRNADLRLYPGYWNGMSGFLDDDQSIEDKVKEELLEELYIDEEQIKAITRGPVLVQEAPKYHKTWIVFTVKVELKTSSIKLDWEHQDFAWLTPAQLKKRKLLPGFSEVLKQFL